MEVHEIALADMFLLYEAALEKKYHKRKATTTASFLAAGSNWAFRLHVLERRDLGYVDFMQQLLLAEDWALWQQQKDEAI